MTLSGVSMVKERHQAEDTLFARFLQLPTLLYTVFAGSQLAQEQTLQWLECVPYTHLSARTNV